MSTGPIRELLTHPCPRCGLPVVGWTASRAHCLPPTDDDAAEWQEHEMRRLLQEESDR